MTVFRAAVIVPAVLATVLLIGWVGHRRSQRALAVDWQSLQTEARAAGLDLGGDTPRQSGWLFAANLAVGHPRLRAPAGLSITSELLLLRRSLPDPARLLLRLPGPITMSAGGTSWRAWGTIDATVGASGVAVLDASALRAATGSGPDDVLTVAALTGTAGERDRSAVLSLRLDRLVLPFARAALPERTVGRASIEASVTGPPEHRRLTIAGADADWNGVAVHLDGTIEASRSGQLSGHLWFTLEPGWPALIARARAAHLVTPAEAQAAGGLLSLVAPNGIARDLPLAVRNGRVTFGGLLLLTLPDLPAAPAPG